MQADSVNLTSAMSRSHRNSPFGQPSTLRTPNPSAKQTRFLCSLKKRRGHAWLSTTTVRPSIHLSIHHNPSKPALKKISICCTHLTINTKQPKHQPQLQFHPLPSHLPPTASHRNIAPEQCPSTSTSPQLACLGLSKRAGGDRSGAPNSTLSFSLSLLFSRKCVFASSVSHSVAVISFVQVHCCCAE